MVKVITYGTFDKLHYGHTRLLERAKALGDYLIVGVTADDFDKTRGKINSEQSLIERIEAVKATGLADEIIVEEYEGQKIDDIKRNDVDIFTIGSDWEGKFDYLNEYCKVIYLPRTKGISSSEIRADEHKLRLGIIGSRHLLNKIVNEVNFVNGIEISGVYAEEKSAFKKNLNFVKSYDDLFEISDAIYVCSTPNKHYEHIKDALMHDKHVICESPITISLSEYEELTTLAKEKNLVLFDAIKTAYSTAYNRMVVLAKSGKIGDVVSVDATCTSLVRDQKRSINNPNLIWNSICDWGPTALLPIMQILGNNIKDKKILTRIKKGDSYDEDFTKIDLLYENAVASIKVGNGVKSEGSLVITGTNGYIYIPAPWWKTDYFEVRFENMEDNQRYFYQLDGEGIRYELVAFVKVVSGNANMNYIESDVSREIISIIDNYYHGDTIKI